MFWPGSALTAAGGFIKQGDHLSFVVPPSLLSQRVQFGEARSIIMTMLRGEFVWRDAKFAGEAGGGMFHECGTPPALAAPPRLSTAFDPVAGKLSE